MDFHPDPEFKSIKTHNHLLSKDRAKLADQLLFSLDALTDAEIELAWFQEATCRAQEMDNGLLQRIPSDVVYQEALSLLK
jgi:hypothetical protein